jgi:hypothetical protein
MGRNHATSLKQGAKEVQPKDKINEPAKPQASSDESALLQSQP